MGMKLGRRSVGRSLASMQVLNPSLVASCRGRRLKPTTQPPYWAGNRLRRQYSRVSGKGAVLSWRRISVTQIPSSLGRRTWVQAFNVGFMSAFCNMMSSTHSPSSSGRTTSEQAFAAASPLIPALSNFVAQAWYWAAGISALEVPLLKIHQAETGAALRARITDPLPRAAIVRGRKGRMFNIKSGRF
jgi:hypothetical protein